MTHHPYLVGLVGTGVGPSLTPALHMAEARAQGLDYVYRTIDLNAVGVAPERIGEVLDWARTLGFDALNVTHPCKRLVIEHLDDLDDVAAAARRGQHRRLRRRRARSATTPTPPASRIGFARGAARRRHRQRGADRRRRGGRRGRRRAAAARHRPPHRRRRRRRPRHRAGPRAGRPPPGGPRRRVGTPTSCRCCCRPATAWCTARPTGMADHPGLPFDAELLHPGLWVADIVYRPLDTALLQRGAGGRLPTSRRRPHGGAPGHRRLRADHRHHPRRRTHVPALPPPRRLTALHHFEKKLGES